MYSLYRLLSSGTMRDEEGKGSRTDLVVYELRQCTNELGCRVEILVHGFFVDVLADVVPEGGFQTLVGGIREVW